MTEPFRFLDLPRDIRFLIYDLCPVVTRHHAITSFGLSPHAGTKYSFIIVSHRIPGISLLATCYIINNEAVGLRRSITALNAAPLRLIGNWRSIGRTATKAILRCASKKECTVGEELKVLLGISFWEFFHCDFDTHEGLLTRFRRSSTTGRVVRCAENAVEFGDDIGDRCDTIAEWFHNFYYWVATMGRRSGGKMQLTWRLKIISEKALQCRKSKEDPFRATEFSEEFWEGEKWTSTVKGGVEEAEMAKWWTEGEAV